LASPFQERNRGGEENNSIDSPKISLFWDDKSRVNKQLNKRLTVGKGNIKYMFTRERKEVLSFYWKLTERGEKGTGEGHICPQTLA
jgi:hypothetical protein